MNCFQFFLCLFQHGHAIFSIFSLFCYGGQYGSTTIKYTKCFSRILSLKFTWLLLLWVWNCFLEPWVTLAVANQFFMFKSNPLTILGYFAQIVVLPLGHLMAATLPEKNLVSMYQLVFFTESRAIQYQGTCSDNHFCQCWSWRCICNKYPNHNQSILQTTN